MHRTVGQRASAAINGEKSNNQTICWKLSLMCSSHLMQPTFAWLRTFFFTMLVECIFGTQFSVHSRLYVFFVRSMKYHVQTRLATSFVAHLRSIYHHVHLVSIRPEKISKRLRADKIIQLTIQRAERLMFATGIVGEHDTILSGGTVVIGH